MVKFLGQDCLGTKRDELGYSGLVDFPGRWWRGSQKLEATQIQGCCEVPSAVLKSKPVASG